MLRPSGDHTGSFAVWVLGRKRREPVGAEIDAWRNPRHPAAPAMDTAATASVRSTTGRSRRARTCGMSTMAEAAAGGVPVTASSAKREIVRRLKTIRRRFLEAAPNDPFECGRHAGHPA